MVLYRDVLTLDVAGFVEAITECSGTARIRRPAIDESDDRRLRLLLSPRCHRPSSRAADQRDERASFPLPEMHPIPHRPERTGRIPDWADRSAGMEGEPQGSPRMRPPGVGADWESWLCLWSCYSRSVTSPSRIWWSVWRGTRRRRRWRWRSWFSSPARRPSAAGVCLAA